jgi:hypothetical protein
LITITRSLAKKAHHYVLIAGSPVQIPFHFQAFIGSAASVGRVDFDKLDDLEKYVRKIVALEKAASPVVSHQAIFFATDHGLNDPTFFSRLHMAEPLAKTADDDLHIPTQSVMGQQATKSNFLERLRTAQPALVYTASHGLGAPDQSLDFQKKYNGGICCEHAFGEPTEDWLLSADDVPNDSFLEGAVFFQFACFGYGTPAQSDYMRWQGDPGLNSNEDFVAALPKKLLAHPCGPIAFIGHCDTAWLHGFDDPQNPNLLSAWHQRLEPFLRAVRVLLGVGQPVGLAMADMSKRYDLLNARLTMACDSLRKKSFKPAPGWRKSISFGTMRRIIWFSAIRPFVFAFRNSLRLAAALRRAGFVDTSMFADFHPAILGGRNWLWFNSSGG